MENTINTIEKIKNSMEKLIEENNFEYLNCNMTDLFTVYSADLCNLLLGIYPGATVMMNKNFKNCALMINGDVYNATGIVNRCDYFIASEQEINFIQRSFNHLSEFIMEKLIEEVIMDIDMTNVSFVLRKNDRTT